MEVVLVNQGSKAVLQHFMGWLRKSHKTSGRVVGFPTLLEYKSAASQHTTVQAIVVTCNLLAKLPNTAHSCSQHGVGTATLILESPAVLCPI